MELSTRTRRALSTVLAVVLAVETVSAVAAAAATRTVTHELPDAPPAGAVLALEAPAPAVVDPADPPVVIVADSPADDVREIAPVVVAAVVPAPKREAVPDKPAKAAKADRGSSSAKAASSGGSKSSRTSTSKASKASASKASPKPASYKGTNHVWIPSLGISRSVRWFPCDRSRPPDNFMYRWGCAGENNVYLMGHAHNVMEPLHDAYVSGRLRVGMKAFYAGPNGKTSVFVVKWWKKTRPTTDAAWAWAPQAVPSMTLQTCVGKNSEYRLMVRLVKVGG